MSRDPITLPQDVMLKLFYWEEVNVSPSSPDEPELLANRKRKVPKKKKPGAWEWDCPGGHRTQSTSRAQSLSSRAQLSPSRCILRCGARLSRSSPRFVMLATHPRASAKSIVINSNWPRKAGCSFETELQSAHRGSLRFTSETVFKKCSRPSNGFFFRSLVLSSQICLTKEHDYVQTGVSVRNVWRIQTSVCSRQAPIDATV